MTSTATYATRRPHLSARSLWEAAGDLVLLVLVGVTFAAHEHTRGPWAVWILVMALLGALVRRRAPEAAAVMTVTASTVAGLLWPGLTPFDVALCAAAQLCLFTLALRRSRRTALAFATVLATSLVTQSVLGQRNDWLDHLGLAYVAWTVAIVCLGLAVKAQRDYVDSLETQQRATEVEREREVTRRLTQERLQIARDLHDSVAHNISIISVHAGSAERNLVRSPDETVASLTAIRQAARTVLGEMQQILAVLRAPDDRDPSVPGMASVPALLTTMRASGLQVWYSQETGTLDLPSKVDLAAYRFLQEALTNAARYGDGSVTTRLERTPSIFEITVRNRTRTTPAPVRTSGFGLVGMDERVSSADGVLKISRSPDEFIVSAIFELPAP